MSNVANAAHQANVGIDFNTNMFSNAVAELSAALQQLIISLSAAAKSSIKAWNLARNSLFTRPADLAGLSTGDIEQVPSSLGLIGPLYFLVEGPPAAGMPSPDLCMPVAAAISILFPMRV